MDKPIIFCRLVRFYPNVSIDLTLNLILYSLILRDGADTGCKFFAESLSYTVNDDIHKVRYTAVYSPGYSACIFIYGVYQYEWPTQLWQSSWEEGNEVIVLWKNSGHHVLCVKLQQNTISFMLGIKNYN